jgi:hypothetical protein
VTSQSCFGWRLAARLEARLAARLAAGGWWLRLFFSCEQKNPDEGS